MPKFAANLSTMFTEYPFLERFAAAAKAGFKGVEFLFPYDYPIADLKQALTDNQLEMVLFNTAPGDTAAGEWGVSAIPGREQEARKHSDLALEYALALGCKQIHIMAAVVPEGANRETYYNTFIDNLRYAADRFAPHGMTILLEALNPKTKPNYLYSSQYETLELVKRVGKENIFTQLDLFHAQLVDGNLSHLITEYSQQYKHIQIASAPDRHEPDEGEINYPWIFDLLDKIGYTGWIGCEYLPRTTTLDGLGWFQKYK